MPRRRAWTRRSSSATTCRCACVPPQLGAHPHLLRANSRSNAPRRSSCSASVPRRRTGARSTGGFWPPLRRRRRRRRTRVSRPSRARARASGTWPQARRPAAPPRVAGPAAFRAARSSLTNAAVTARPLARASADVAERRRALRLRCGGTRHAGRARCREHVGRHVAVAAGAARGGACAVRNDRATLGSRFAPPPPRRFGYNRRALGERANGRLAQRRAAPMRIRRTNRPTRRAPRRALLVDAPSAAALFIGDGGGDPRDLRQRLPAADRVGRGGTHRPVPVLVGCRVLVTYSQGPRSVLVGCS